jgi:hypothetical protein
MKMQGGGGGLQRNYRQFLHFYEGNITNKKLAMRIAVLLGFLALLLGSRLVFLLFLLGLLDVCLALRHRLK